MENPGFQSCHRGNHGASGRCRGPLKNSAYRLGRIHSLHLQIRKGKEIVRRATVAVIDTNDSAAGSGQSLIHPLRNFENCSRVMIC